MRNHLFLLVFLGARILVILVYFMALVDMDTLWTFFNFSRLSLLVPLVSSLVVDNRKCLILTNRYIFMNLLFFALTYFCSAIDYENSLASNHNEK